MATTTSNLSIISLPFYYALCQVPHAYAIITASGGNLAKWDNSNPRADSKKDGLRKKLGAQVYARYERGEAAHYNSLESIPMFYTAVIVANMARLSKDDMNTFIIGQFVLRLLYQIVYIRTESKGPITTLRTAVWYTQTGWILRVLYRAGVALM